MNERYDFVMQKAHKVIDKYFLYVPFDFERFCKNIGIKMMPLSLYLENGFTKQEFFDSIGNQDGAASRSGGTYYIFYNDFQPHHRIRFTLAEELMHIVLGHANDMRFWLGRSYDDEIYTQYENEAKLGASLLLMPPTLYYKYRNRFNLKQLAAICDISESAAFRSIRYLEDNEDFIRNFFGTYCPRCDISKVSSGKRPISVWADKEYSFL